MQIINLRAIIQLNLIGQKYLVKLTEFAKSETTDQQKMYQIQKHH